MELDFSQCRICTPTGGALSTLYAMLMEVFPPDRPLFAAAMERGERLYTWTPYALYLGGELLGSVSLFPMRIWCSGQATNVIGIASLATREPYRKQGVARYLLRHCLSLVDHEKRPSVLFTSLPRVYEGMGFKAIDQTYLATSAGELDFSDRGFSSQPVDVLEDHQVRSMATIYAEKYPNYDGTVVRDPDYWGFYRLLFDPAPSARIVFSIGDGRVRGYVRTEVEKDRLLVCELCGEASATDAAEALLSFARDHALEANRELVTFALPEDHFVWKILERRNVRLEPEPAGAARETCMVRPAAGQALGALERLEWSLADKF